MSDGVEMSGAEARRPGSGKNSKREAAGYYHLMSAARRRRRNAGKARYRRMSADSVAWPARQAAIIAAGNLISRFFAR